MDGTVDAAREASAELVLACRDGSFTLSDMEHRLGYRSTEDGSVEVRSSQIRNNSPFTSAPRFFISFLRNGINL